MIETASTPGAGDQARLELAVAAESAERANRPKGLIYLGGACVLAAVIASFMAFSSRTAAGLQLAEQKKRLRTLIESRDEITRLSQTLDSKGVDPDARMGVRLEDLAKAAGLTLSGPISDTPDLTLTMQGAVRKIYTAQVGADQNPENVLKWLASVQSDEATKNLEITQLRISQSGGGGPSGKGGSTTELRFARWEKREARR